MESEIEPAAVTAPGCFPRLISRHGPARLGDLLFGLLALIVILLRFRILREGGAPPTIDAGNWLAFGDGILGRGTRSTTIVYPPVVPLLTTGAVQAFGLVTGISAVGAISSAAPAIGVYWTLRRCRLGIGALVPGLLVLGASSVGEAAAWGGFPQLISLGLLPVTLLSFDQLARTWGRRDALRAGFVLMLILATSHLIASVAITASVVIVTIGLVSQPRSRPGIGRIAERVGIAVLPSMWLVPVYVTLTRQIILDDNGFRRLTGLEWGSLADRIEFLFRDLTLVWWPLFGLVLIAPLLLIGRRHLSLWRIPTGLLIATAVLTAATREGRYLYVFTVIAGLSLGLWIAVLAARVRIDLEGRLPIVLRARVALGLVITAVILAVQIAGGVSFFREQRNFYGLLSPDLVAAIDHVAATTGPNDTIGVPSHHDAPLGWWVEAITRQPTLYGVPLRWIVFDDEIERATRANRLFVPPFPTAESLADAVEEGISVILLPTEWVFYDTQAIDDLERQFPDAVDRFNPGATLLYPAAAQP